jgi:hypothetical protein
MGLAADAATGGTETVAVDDIEGVLASGILAPTCDQKYAGASMTLALFTVSFDFPPRGTERKTRLVEFADDPGP